MNVLNELYEIVLQRKQQPVSESYTNYLFDAGLDKILKKVAEESGETIIAAKNGDNKQLVSEISDLLYHLIVLMAQSNVDIKDVENELIERTNKIGNLKKMKITDKNT